GGRAGGRVWAGYRPPAGDPTACDCLVEAAGEWAGELARAAGASPIEITPRRRCIATFAAPAGLDVARWPLVAHESKHVYFAPESGGLLVSPMDEVAMAPCDARPDDEALAIAVERLSVIAPSLAPRTFRRKWAGLRTFAPDRVPVVGADPELGGFFWLAGQGGCGIETSPMVGAIAADLLLDGKTARVDATKLSPTRFGWASFLRGAPNTVSRVPSAARISRTPRPSGAGGPSAART